MARTDPKNLTDFWKLKEMPGVDFLQAQYETHTFSPHVHEELVIGMTEAGSGHFVTNGRDHVATRSSLILFNPDEPHHGGVLAGHNWSYRALYLDPVANLELMRQITESESSCYFSNNNVFDHTLVEKAVDFHRLSRGEATRLELESGLISLLAGIIMRYGDPAPRLPKCNNEKQAVKQIRDYIHSNYAEAIALNDLGSLVQMSGFQIIRAFRKETGLTPHAYLNQVRLSRSKQLILGGLPLTEVANAAAFSIKAI
jgi:AraC-like DNA-binding protein